MTPETGPLRVIPGSHVYPVAIPETRLADPHPDEQLLEVRAGDAVVIHHNLIHSGTHNVTSGERRFFSFTYSHSALHQDEEFKGPNCQRLRERARRQADRRLLRLLGEDETLQARVNTGFTWPTRQDWRRWSREDDEVCRSPVIASVHTDRWYRDD